MAISISVPLSSWGTFLYRVSRAKQYISQTPSQLGFGAKITSHQSSESKNFWKVEVKPRLSLATFSSIIIIIIIIYFSVIYYYYCYYTWLWRHKAFLSQPSRLVSGSPGNVVMAAAGAEVAQIPASLPLFGYQFTHYILERRIPKVISKTAFHLIGQFFRVQKMIPDVPG